MVMALRVRIENLSLAPPDARPLPRRSIVASLTGRLRCDRACIEKARRGLYRILGFVKKDFVILEASGFVPLNPPIRRAGDPAIRRPGDPATRRPGQWAT
jgi:hypothetical protein